MELAQLMDYSTSVIDFNSDLTLELLFWLILGGIGTRSFFKMV